MRLKTIPLRVQGCPHGRPLQTIFRLVYLTSLEQLESDILFYSSVVLFSAAAAIDLWVKPVRK